MNEKRASIRLNSDNTEYFEALARTFRASVSSLVNVALIKYRMDMDLQDGTPPNPAHHKILTEFTNYTHKILSTAENPEKD